MSGCCEDKLSRLRGYVPFLEKMISKLCRAQDPAKDPQLQKMKSLLAILTQPQKKLKMDTLDKCEQVLQKLYEKVEGGPLQSLRKPESSSSASTPRSPSPSPSPRSPSPPTQKRTPSATSRTSDHNRVKPMTHVEPWSNRPQPRPNSPSQGPWNPGGAPFQRPPQGGPPHFNNGPWREGRGPRFNNDFHPGGPRFGGGPPSRFGGGPQPFQRGGFGMGPRGMGPGGPPFNHGGFQGGPPRFGPRGHGPNQDHGPFPSNNPSQGFPGGHGNPFQGSQDGPSPNFYGGGPNRDFNSDNSQPWHFQDRDPPDFNNQRFNSQPREQNNRRNFNNSNRFCDETRNNSPDRGPFDGPSKLRERHSRFECSGQGKERPSEKSSHDPERESAGRLSREDSARDAAKGKKKDQKEESPASPPPETPMSPDFNTPASPDEGNTPMSPDIHTPASPDQDTPMSPEMQETPQSPPASPVKIIPEHKRSLPPLAKDQPKVIPLERKPTARSINEAAKRAELINRSKQQQQHLESSQLLRSHSTSTDSVFEVRKRQRPPPLDTPASPDEALDGTQSSSTPKPGSGGQLKRQDPRQRPKPAQSEISLQASPWPTKRLDPRKRELPSVPKDSMVSHEKQHSVFSRRPDPRRRDQGAIDSPSSPPSSSPSSSTTTTSNPPPVPKPIPTTNNRDRPPLPPGSAIKRQQQPSPPPSRPSHSSRINSGPGLLPIPLPPISQQQQQQQGPAAFASNPRMMMQPQKPTGSHHFGGYQGQLRPPPDPRNSPFHPGKALTYGQYRKMREEQERHYQKMLEAERKRSAPKLDSTTAAPNTSEPTSSEKESDSSMKKTEPTPPSSGDPAAAVAKFKIPKKKRPSTDGKESAVPSTSSTRKETIATPRDKSTKISARKESESDSENELRIVEDVVEPGENLTREAPKKIETDENDPTKRMLKNIVGSLETKAAERLMKKASNLEKKGKLTLKQLKLLLADDSDSEDEEEEEQVKDIEEKIKETVTEDDSNEATANKEERKGEVKKKPKSVRPATVKVSTPTAGTKSSSSKLKKESPPAREGTRRSRRLNLSGEIEKKDEQLEENEANDEKLEPKSETPVADEISELMTDDSEDDAENLVIDEGLPSFDSDPEASSPSKPPEKDSPEKEKIPEPLPMGSPVKVVAKKRGRPKKIVDKTPDDKPSINAQSEQDIHMSEDADKSVTDTIVHAEKGEHEDDDEIVEVSPRATRSRMSDSKQKMSGPKSKTWFPSSRNAPSRKSDKKQEHFFNKSDVPSEDLLVPKKEPKDVDIKVFLGSEDLILKDEFKIKSDISVNPTIVSGLKESSVNRLFLKFQNQTRNEKIADTPEEKLEKNVEKSRKVNNEAVSEALLFQPLIVTAKPKEYAEQMSKTIQKLKEQIPEVPDESEEYKIRAQKSNLSFLFLVKDLKKKSGPSLANNIPEAEDAVGDMQILIPDKTAELLCTRRSAAGKWKNEDKFNEQMDPKNAPNLFKCFGLQCSFSSDDPEDFLGHLEETHANSMLESEEQEDIVSDQSWLHCAYCNQTLVSANKLVSHVIARHGSHKIQCSYCYFRSQTQLSLFIHQQAVHPDREKGFINCSHHQIEDDTASALQEESNHDFSCQDCPFKADSQDKLAEHISLHNRTEQTDLLCSHCPKSFKNVTHLICHTNAEHLFESSLKQRGAACKITYRETEARELGGSDSLSDDDFDQDYYYDSTSSGEEVETRQGQEKEGQTQISQLDRELFGADLYRCGNDNCNFSAEFLYVFRAHLSTCDLSNQELGFYTCCHCKKQLKHIPTLLEHLKTHGPRRYSCSLCSYKAAVPINVKNHLRAVHRVNFSKFVPVDPCKNNQDQDLFLLVPKNSIPRSVVNNSRTAKKDTFSPDEIDSIPRVSMLRYLIRCSICDFVTKVRHNLVKHLKLHSKQKMVKKSSSTATTTVVPLITPINPPVSDDQHAGKMTILLEADTEEEKSKRPMAEEELAQLPILVSENQRYACPDRECQYCTIDEVMLQYHIDALHSNLEVYDCPHCPKSVVVPFADLEFHMRCHGDLLFRCGHCPYYHWQKRTAEKHVQEHHPQRKQYVRDVRKEADLIQKLKDEAEKSSNSAPQDSDLKVTKAGSVPKSEPYKYLPWKCGLCEAAEETIEEIKEHCVKIHELERQFKCSLCEQTSDIKAEIETHYVESHPDLGTREVIRIFFVDPSNPEMLLEEKREPLWSRNMPGLKHIRGILYDEELPAVQPIIRSTSSTRKSSSSISSATTPKMSSSQIPSTTAGASGATSPDKHPVLAKEAKTKLLDEADNFPMKCKECGLMKKCIKGLKMHIKLMHLRTGKFRCKKCQFSANILNSIHTHYKIKHPDSIGPPDFEERNDEPKVFPHEYWKETWGIPTLDERKEMVENRGSPTGEGKRKPEEDIEELASPAKVKKRKKRGVKRKLTVTPTLDLGLHQDQVPMILNRVPTEESTAITAAAAGTTSSSGTAVPLLMEGKKIKLIEVSPFETKPTYKCQSCPKRSQNMERIQRHINEEHLGKSEDDFKTMTRDQIVDMLTLMKSNFSCLDYKCFYCDDVIGSIHSLKEHFELAHQGDSFKVKSFQGKGVNGYLECQLCGHLTPGLEWSKQRIHFHEEHPLETNVNASKYVSKVKHLPGQSQQPEQTKFDFSKFNGVTMYCPKDGCEFNAKSHSAMNNHIRKHTRSFKCGHCGKTHHTSSEFHRHSAMSHGDKIPDQVKDPEADAEFAALRALLEARLMTDDSERKPSDVLLTEAATEAGPSKESNEVTTPSAVKKYVARKSTGGSNKPLKISNIARKSTGPRANAAYYSYYGLPYEPEDLRKISTTMSMGGMEIAIKANKMSELINLQPKVKVEDCNKEKKDGES